MEVSEMIWVATWAWHKRLSKDDLLWCDHMYGNEHYTDDVWEYVEEMNEIDKIAFYEKYKEYKLYYG